MDRVPELRDDGLAEAGGAHIVPLGQKDAILSGGMAGLLAQSAGERRHGGALSPPKAVTEGFAGL